jgi:LPXTG-motif cell wall-anchored protein
MRDLISKGLLTAAAATSVLSLSGGYALAVDSEGTAAESPGLLSGNNIQAPLEVPVNVCGNTVDPVGVLNPAFGNGCGNSSGSQEHATHRDADHGRGTSSEASSTSTRPSHHHGDDDRTPPGAGHAEGHGHPYTSDLAFEPADGHDLPGGTSATGTTEGSPGVLSGNLVQAPLDIPLNVCGDSVDVVGLLNPAFGNDCTSGPEIMPEPEAPRPEAPRPEAPRPEVPGMTETPEPPAPTPTHDRTIPPAPEKPDTPKPDTPKPITHHVTPPRAETPPAPQLAETGSDANLLATAGMSAALLIGGGILYRRNPAGARV